MLQIKQLVRLCDLVYSRLRAERKLFTVKLRLVGVQCLGKAKGNQDRVSVRRSSMDWSHFDDQKECLGEFREEACGF